MGYIESNEKAVEYALKLAYSEYGRPITPREIIEVADRYEIKAQRTSLSPKGYGPRFHIEDPSRLSTTEEVVYHIAAGGFTEGGFNAFDWPDRVVRFLKRLQKEGKVEVWKEGRTWFAIPLESLGEGALSFQSERALLGEDIGGSGFHEFEEKLSLEGLESEKEGEK